MHSKRAGGGQVMPMVALLMVVILGVTAFAIDGSNLYSQHRKLQADLDVAVKVAASEMWNFNPADAAYADTAKTAIADAAQLLANDGYTNTLTITTSPDIQPSGDGFCGNDPHAGIVLCNPPQNSKYYSGSPHYDYVEGSISRDVQGFFGGVIGLDKMHISVRAVAWHGGFHEPYALIGLDPAGACTVDGSGGSLTVAGSIVGDALTCGGANPSVSGHSDEVGGGNSGQIVGQAGDNQYVPLVTDPFSPTGVIAPTEPVMVVNAGSSDTIPPQCYAEVEHYIPTITAADLAATPQTLPIATYVFPPADGNAGIAATQGNLPGNTGTVEYLPRCDGTPEGQPGVYYFTQSTLSPGKIDINSYNSVFIFDSSMGTLFHDTGQASWTLDAPTSGPYQGIALTQSRTTQEPPCPSTNPIDWTGGGGGKGVFTANGVVDVPCATITAQGSSTVTINGVLVTYELTTSGSTTFTINYDPSGTPADKGSVLVE